MMINKAKKNIKCLDTSIDLVYNSPISYPSILFFALAVIAKHAVVATAQAHIS